MQMLGAHRGVTRCAEATATKAGPSYPTSSKKTTNWDALAQSALEEEEKSKEGASSGPNSGGDKQLNELFQKLYANATDEQRRAMIKSYQESNGTALSTDWSTVKEVSVGACACERMMLIRRWLLVLRVLSRRSLRR